MTLGWICSAGCPWLMTVFWLGVATAGFAILFVISGIGYLISKRSTGGAGSNIFRGLTRFGGFGAAIGVALLAVLVPLMNILGLD